SATCKSGRLPGMCIFSDPGKGCRDNSVTESELRKAWLFCCLPMISTFLQSCRCNRQGEKNTAGSGEKTRRQNQHSRTADAENPAFLFPTLALTRSGSPGSA